MRALANFDSIDLNDNLAVRPNVDKRIGRINLRRWSLRTFLSRRRKIEVKRNHQSAGSGGRDAEKVASIDRSMFSDCVFQVHLF